jgi:hypothetical protein
VATTDVGSWVAPASHLLLNGVFSGEEPHGRLDGQPRLRLAQPHLPTTGDKSAPCADKHR